MSTKEKILDVAEEMFFLEGYDNVSVRDITKAADANVASVNYHFNSKRDLYREVFKRTLGRVAGQKMDAIREQLKGETPLKVESVVRALVTNIMEDMLQDGSDRKVLIITQEMSSEGGIAHDVVLEELVVPLQKFSWGLLKQALPGIDKTKVSLYFSSIIGQIFHFAKSSSMLSKTLATRP